MNRKIKRYLDEIERTEKKIEELQAYLKGVRVALKAEDEESGSLFFKENTENGKESDYGEMEKYE